MRFKFKPGFLSLMLLAGTIASCNKALYLDCEVYDYADCITQEPFDGELTLKILINDDNKAVPITIYQGYFENGVVLIRDTLGTESASYYLECNQYYSATAEYHTSGGHITAVDGARIEKNSEYRCDSLCWEVKDVTLDLRLKE